MKVLIVGASGLVGGACYKLFEEDGRFEATGTYRTYRGSIPGLHFFDPATEDPFKDLDTNWDFIIHTGALTNVDLCEKEVELSYHSTVLSTKKILDFANNIGSKIVYISTDYVFDGSRGPYTEDDPVHPLNMYGKHKLEAEQIVLSGKGSLVVRVTGVYGDEERGKNFIGRLIGMAISKEEHQLLVPQDQFATPINAMDIARAIMQLIKNGKAGIYHLASTDIFSRYQLSKKVLQYFPQHAIDCKPIKTSDLKQPAKRPLLGGLISNKFLSEFPEFDFTNVDDHISVHFNNK